MMVSALLEREQSGALPIRNGAFIAVVGPSGAGKDTLIAHARAALSGEPQVEFVRRVITRPCDGATEDHDTLADAAFDEALADGAFAIAWEAHGLRYGLPASVDLAIENGHVAVANVSRGSTCLRCGSATPMSPWSRSPPRPKSWRRGLPRAAANRAARCWRGSPARSPSRPPDRASSRSTTAGRRKSRATSSSPSSARRWRSPTFREQCESRR